MCTKDGGTIHSAMIYSPSSSDFYNRLPLLYEFLIPPLFHCHNNTTRSSLKPQCTLQHDPVNNLVKSEWDLL